MKNQLTYAEAMAFLGAIPGKESLAKIGNMRTKSVVKYVAFTSTTLTQNGGKCITQATLKVPGTSNFDGANILPSGKNLLVKRVRVLADTNAGKTTANAIYDTVAPVDFKNGEFKISQSGQGTLFEASGSAVTNFKASTGNDADFVDVTPFVLREQTEFSIEITLNGAVTAAVYKVELDCIEVIDPTKNS